MEAPALAAARSETMSEHGVLISKSKKGDWRVEQDGVVVKSGLWYGDALKEAAFLIMDWTEEHGDPAYLPRVRS